MTKDREAAREIDSQTARDDGKDDEHGVEKYAYLSYPAMCERQRFGTLRSPDRVNKTDQVRFTGSITS
jgi:hypothetical protein